MTSSSDEATINITFKTITNVTVELTVKSSDSIEDTIHDAADALRVFAFDASGGSRVCLIFGGSYIFKTTAFEWTEGCGTKSWADVEVGDGAIIIWQTRSRNN